MRGVSYRGDIGLDDISFTDGPCCKLQINTASGDFDLVRIPTLSIWKVSLPGFQSSLFIFQRIAEIPEGFFYTPLFLLPFSFSVPTIDRFTWFFLLHSSYRFYYSLSSNGVPILISIKTQIPVINKVKTNGRKDK